MNEYEYNRFKHLTELTNEELVKELDSAQEEMDYMLEELDDPMVVGEQKSEYRNSDIPYRRDEINFINQLISQREIDVDAVREASGRTK